MLRCKEGDLARIVRSEASNEGRMVSVVRKARPMDVLLIGGGGFAFGTFREALPHIASLWIVQPLQPLRMINLRTGGIEMDMQQTVFLDSWLQPIRGLPEGDETDAGTDTPADIGEVAEA